MSEFNALDLIHEWALDEGYRCTKMYGVSNYRDYVLIRRSDVSSDRDQFIRCYLNKDRSSVEVSVLDSPVNFTLVLSHPEFFNNLRDSIKIILDHFDSLADLQYEFRVKVDGIKARGVGVTRKHVGGRWSTGELI